MYLHLWRYTGKTIVFFTKSKTITPLQTLIYNSFYFTLFREAVQFFFRVDKPAIYNNLKNSALRSQQLHFSSVFICKQRPQTGGPWFIVSLRAVFYRNLHNPILLSLLQAYLCSRLTHGPHYAKHITLEYNGTVYLLIVGTLNTISTELLKNDSFTTQPFTS